MAELEFDPVPFNSGADQLKDIGDTITNFNSILEDLAERTRNAAGSDPAGSSFLEKVNPTIKGLRNGVNGLALGVHAGRNNLLDLAKTLSEAEAVNAESVPKTDSSERSAPAVPREAGDSSERSAPAVPREAGDSSERSAPAVPRLPSAAVPRLAASPRDAVKLTAVPGTPVAPGGRSMEPTVAKSDATAPAPRMPGSAHVRTETRSEASLLPSEESQTSPRNESGDGLARRARRAQQHHREVDDLGPVRRTT